MDQNVSGVEELTFKNDFATQIATSVRKMRPGSETNPHTVHPSIERHRLQRNIAFFIASIL